MSFSSQVKEELAACLPTRACCKTALAYGLLECGHAFSGTRISLRTEHKVVAELYAHLTAQICGVPVLLGAGQALIETADQRVQVLDRFGHTPQEVTVRLNRANLDCEECAAAYVRGAFLSCGAVTDPVGGYHLEFCVPHFTLSKDVSTLLREQGIDIKQVVRKGAQVLYLKESEQIEDCLTRMGAQNASLELMGVKLVKNIRNNANRVVNCESANIDKTVAAAALHRWAVREIERTRGLDSLPVELRELAQLRMENPEMSLRELGENMSVPLSRSGVYHRFQRIVALAQERT